MGPEEKRCENCGERHKVCPECGDRKITPLEPQEGPITVGIRRHIQQAEDGEELEFENICWECGWKETISFTVNKEIEMPE